MNEEAGGAEQAQPRIGRVGVTVHEGAGEVVLVARFREPKDHFGAGKLDGETVGGIGEPGDGEGVESVFGPLAVSSVLQGEPEDAAVAQQAEQRRARLMGVDRHVPGNTGCQCPAGLGPQRVMPRWRQQR